MSGASVGDFERLDANSDTEVLRHPTFSILVAVRTASELAETRV